MTLVEEVDVSTLKGRALKEYYRSVQGVFQDPFRGLDQSGLITMPEAHEGQKT